MKLDGATIKTFLVNHVEKFGFALALLLVALFVYSGYKLEGYKKTPVELRSVASDASQKIADDTWAEKLEEEALDPKRAFSKEVKESTSAIDYSAYQVDKVFIPVASNSIIRRSDPELYAPLNLEVDVQFGPIAVASRAADPLAALEPAPKPEAPEIRQPRARPPPPTSRFRGRRRRRRDGGDVRGRRRGPRGDDG